MRPTHSFLVFLLLFASAWAVLEMAEQFSRYCDSLSTSELATPLCSTLPGFATFVIE